MSSSSSLPLYAYVVYPPFYSPQQIDIIISVYYIIITARYQINQQYYVLPNYYAN